jgi:hypothetical protein
LRDVDTFLSQLAETRRLAQAAPDGFVMPAELELPSDLELAIGRRWLIAPIHALSKYALSLPNSFVPSCSRKQIEYWYAQHLEANWVLQTGPQSGVVSLEVDPRYVRLALLHLARGDDSWRRTLRFAHCGKWQVLFGYANGLRTVGERYIGLRLHCGDLIYAPPSMTPDGIRVEFVDPHAPVLPAPDWLISAMHP